MYVNMETLPESLRSLITKDMYLISSAREENFRYEYAEHFWDFSVNRRYFGGHKCSLLYKLLELIYNKKSDDEETREHYRDFIKELLKLPNIDVNQVTKHGSTPLLLGCGIGKLELVELLLAHPGIDVNKVTNRREHKAHKKIKVFPLLYAVHGGNPSVIQLLLNHPKIDINQRGSWGESALTLATDLFELASIKLTEKIVALTDAQKKENVIYGGKLGWRIANLQREVDKRKHIVQILLMCPKIQKQVTYIPMLIDDRSVLFSDNLHNQYLIKNYLASHTYYGGDMNYYCGHELLEAVTKGDEERVRTFLDYPKIDINYQVTYQSVWDQVCSRLRVPPCKLNYSLSLQQNFNLHNRCKEDCERIWNEICSTAFLGYHPNQHSFESLSRYREDGLGGFIIGDWVRTGASGDTPLIRAYELGHRNIVNLLFKHPRINPNQFHLTTDLLQITYPDIGVARSLLATSILRNDEEMVQLFCSHPMLDVTLPMMYSYKREGPVRTRYPMSVLDLAEQQENPVILGYVRSVFPAPPVSHSKKRVERTQIKNRKLFRTFMKALGERKMKVMEEIFPKLHRKQLCAKGPYKHSHAQRILWNLAEMPFSKIFTQLLEAFPQFLNVRTKENLSLLELAANEDLPDTVGYLLNQPNIEVNALIYERLTSGGIGYRWVEYTQDICHTFSISSYCAYLIKKYYVKKHELRALTELCLFARKADGTRLPDICSDVERFVIAPYLLPVEPERTKQEEPIEEEDEEEEEEQQIIPEDPEEIGLWLDRRREIIQQQQAEEEARNVELNIPQGFFDSEVDNNDESIRFVKIDKWKDDGGLSVLTVMKGMFPHELCNEWDIRAPYGIRFGRFVVTNEVYFISWKCGDEWFQKYVIDEIVQLCMNGAFQANTIIKVELEVPRSKYERDDMLDLSGAVLNIP